MSEMEYRCDYLTSAIWNGASSTKPAEDFRDLITETLIPERLVERVRSALSSGYTLAVFNGSIAFGSLDAHSAEAVFPDLKEAFERCSEIDQWKEQGGMAAAADLPLTINLIQMEILGSIGRSGSAKPEVLELLISSLKEQDDSLHFAALESIRNLGRRAFSASDDLIDYLDRVGDMALPEVSIPRLRDAANLSLREIV